MSSIATRLGLHKGRIAADPLWLAAPGLVFLAVFLFVPVLRLMALSVQDPDTGALTARHFRHLLEVHVYVRVLGTTFRFAAITSVLSVALGYPVAYWLAKQPDTRRGYLTMIILVPLWTSYLVKTFAWMVLLGRMGIVNAAADAIGIGRLSLVNNDFGVLLAMVHGMLPLTIVTMLPVMTGIDSRQVPVAGSLGATAAQRFWLVYFPQSTSGMVAAGLLCFISSLGFFIVPALLGDRHQTMLAQLIITEVQDVLDWNFAGALSVLLLAATVVSVLAYDRIFGLSSLSGEASNRTLASGAFRNHSLTLLHWLGRGSDRMRGVIGSRAAHAALPVYAMALIGFLVLPILAIVPMAFSSSPFLSFPPSGYSLHWFELYFGSDVWMEATLRSVCVALATGFLATLIGGAAALGLARSRSRWGGSLFILFLAPMIVPQIVVAIGLYYLFAQIGLVATDAGLIIGHTLLAIPLSMIAISAVLKNYDWRFDQVASTLGADRARAIRLVTLPLIRGGLMAAFLFAFLTSFDELTVALFASGGIKTTLPKQMWDDVILQVSPTLAAASTVILVTVSLLLVVAERLRRST
jgi:putative spermidine/putrescine transport system permease protein